jgi:hypothetical protein
MLVSQALQRIKKQFGDEYGVVIEDVDIYGWILDAESDIIRTTGCNSKTVTVPEQNFPMILSMAVNVERIALNGVPLTYIAVEELDLLGLSTGAVGEPRYWYKQMENNTPNSIATKVYIWPETDQTRNFIVSYTVVPSLMTDVVVDNNKFTVPEVFQEDVIKYCIGRAHNKNNNLQAEKMQMDMYDRNLNIRRDEAQNADVVLYKIGDSMDFEQMEYS